MLKHFVIGFIIFSASLTAQDTSSVEADSLEAYSYLTIPELRKEIKNILSDSSFNNASWGVVIQSLKTGEYIYKQNENKLFVPASNLKLFTAAAGLYLLGGGYQFSTNMFINGTKNYSVINGDIIVQGRGDPTISGRFHDEDIYAVFDDWADSLLDLGVSKIKGNIIGDDNQFDDIGLGQGWSWDYETYWFAAPSGALSYNDNCVDLSIYYDEKLDSVMISVSPELENIVVLNNVKAVSPGEGSTNIELNRERGTTVINVSGLLSKQSDTLKTYATIPNPTLFAMSVFKERLETKGIKVDGYAMDIDDVDQPVLYENLQHLFTHYSPYLGEIIKVINKGSQNFFAEQLLKTIGLEKKGIGTTDNGIYAANEMFSQWGLDTTNILMYDGSGLSNLNRVTPLQITKLLKHIYSTRYFVPFFNSLPIAGIDGTLGRRMKGTRAENNVRGKTGYIAYSRCLSGYAFSGDGEPIVFSLMANNFSVPVKLAENIQDSICVLLSNFKRKITEQ